MGRQLEEFGDFNYCYNENGIRTVKNIAQIHKLRRNVLCNCRNLSQFQKSLVVFGIYMKKQPSFLDDSRVVLMVFVSYSFSLLSSP